MNDYLITVVEPNQGYAGPETKNTIRLIGVTDDYLKAFIDGVKACYPSTYSIHKEKLT